jgi:NACHT domain
MVKTKSSTKSAHGELDKSLLDAVYGALPAAGESGFESIVAHQLSRITSTTFRLAKSGRQFGIDALSSHATTIAVQCKRYGRRTSLDIALLQVELNESRGFSRKLDAWVLATTQTLAANDVEVLRQRADDFGVEFIAIDSSGSWPSNLDVLLASDLQILHSHLAKHKPAKVALIDRLAKKVRAAPSFNLQLNKLRERLSDARIGYDHWRRKSHALIQKGFANDDQSVKIFHQNLNLAHAKSKTVRRTQVHADLDRWWESQQPQTGVQRSFMAITGEEGDGKTWILANWLEENIGNNQSDFPSVVWLPSKDVSSSDLLSCLRHHLQQVCGTEPEHGRKQLDRWLSAADSPRPKCLLVIDGLNESPRTSLWRTLLAEYIGSSSKLALSLIVTTRNGYWQKYLPMEERSSPSVISVASFSDTEFAEALQKSGLRATDFPTEINDLVRKPRYFDLALRFRAEINNTGRTITRARLVYEDMRARYSSKVGYPISNEKFQEHLVKLAKLYAPIEY